MKTLCSTLRLETTNDISEIEIYFGKCYSTIFEYKKSFLVKQRYKVGQRYIKIIYIHKCVMQYVIYIIYHCFILCSLIRQLAEKENFNYISNICNYIDICF